MNKLYACENKNAVIRSCVLIDPYGVGEDNYNLAWVATS